MTSLKNHSTRNMATACWQLNSVPKHTENTMFPLLSLGCQILFKPSDYQSFRNLALQQPHSFHVNGSVKQSSLLSFRAILGTDFPSEIFTFRESCQSDFRACLFVVQSHSLGFCGPPGCCTCGSCEKVAFGQSWRYELVSWIINSKISQLTA